nr:hypothetical protein [Tanacetum cinerariifolium]
IILEADEEVIGIAETVTTWDPLEKVISSLCFKTNKKNYENIGKNHVDKSDGSESEVVEVNDMAGNRESGDDTVSLRNEINDYTTEFPSLDKMMNNEECYSKEMCMENKEDDNSCNMTTMRSTILD